MDRDKVKGKMEDLKGRIKPRQASGPAISDSRTMGPAIR